MKVPEARPVVVDGATGYVGTHLVWKLTNSGVPVRCLVRPQANPADIAFLTSCGCEIASADLDDAAALWNILKGARAAVHLIGSIAPRRGERLEDLHVGQTRNLLSGCKASGVDKVVMVTALGAASDAPSLYHRTKYSAEESLRLSGLDFVVLRPSLIVGRIAGGRDSKLIRRYLDLIATRKAVPLVAGGNSKVQPIYIGDLTEALLAALESDQFSGRTLELGGSDIVTMRALVERLMDARKTRKPLLSIPPVVARVVAACCEKFQTVPLLSRDQVTLSLMDNLCESNALPAMLKTQPTSLDQALQSYASVQPPVVAAAI